MKYFRYTLNHSVVGSLVLTYAPQEWASDSAFWERSMTYWGIFRSFSTKELSIIKNGATWIKNVFDTYGTEAEVSYQVEAFNPSTFDYDVIYTGILDFSTYRFEDRGRYDVVKIQVIDDNFLNTVKTREAVNVSLAKLTDVDGDAITPFSNEGIEVDVPIHNEVYSADFSGSETISSLSDRAPVITCDIRDEDSAVTPTSTTMGNAGSAFIVAAYTIDYLTINVVMNGTIGFVGAEVIEIRLRKYNSGGTPIQTEVLGTYTTPSGTIAIDDTVVMSLVSGNWVALEVDVTGGSPGITATYTIAMDITWTKQVADAYTFVGYPYHEAFTRILQSITGQANPFYSALLGRTDSEERTYAADGDLSLGVVTNGLLIRGFSLTDTDVALNASFRSLFQALSAVYPICAGVEEVSGAKVMRIEELTYAFDTHYFLTIENCSNISEEVAVDLTYSGIRIGFSKFDDGAEDKKRYEFNRESQYVTPLKRHSNEFNAVSPYRADGSGMIAARETLPSEDNGAKSSPADSDNFIVSIVRDGSNIEIKRDEGYTAIWGVDNPEHIYNVDYAPARSLKRWGSFLRGCLEKYTTGILFFAASDRNSGMSSMLPAEFPHYPCAESRDIDIDELNDPFFENIYYNFDCVVNNAMITLLNGVSTAGKPNAYFIVRFRANATESYKYGWIMKVEARKEGNKGMGTVKLLKVDTTYVTPTAASISYTADSTTITVDSTSVTVDNT